MRIVPFFWILRIIIFLSLLFRWILLVSKFYFSLNGVFLILIRTHRRNIEAIWIALFWAIFSFLKSTKREPASIIQCYLAIPLNGWPLNTFIPAIGHSWMSHICKILRQTYKTGPSVNTGCYIFFIHMIVGIYVRRWSALNDAY
jgi:hypothetical protein